MVWSRLDNLIYEIRSTHGPCDASTRDRQTLIAEEFAPSAHTVPFPGAYIDLPVTTRTNEFLYTSVDYYLLSQSLSWRARDFFYTQQSQSHYDHFVTSTPCPCLEISLLNPESKLCLSSESPDSALHWSIQARSPAPPCASHSILVHYSSSCSTMELPSCKSIFLPVHFRSLLSGLSKLCFIIWF